MLYSLLTISSSSCINMSQYCRPCFLIEEVDLMPLVHERNAIDVTSSG